MTGHQLRALLNDLSSEQLNFELYIIYQRQAVPLTADNIRLQPKGPLLRGIIVEGLHEKDDKCQK